MRSRHHRHHHHLSREASLTSFAGVAAIAATFIIAVTLVGPGLRTHAERAFGSPHAWLGLFLPALGGGVGALAAALLFRIERGARQLAEGYGACAVALILALATRHGLVVGTALLILGAGLGWAAVMLALCLRPTIHLHRLGLWCGIGVGLGYALCTQPLVLRGTPALQLIIAIFGAAMGMAVSFRFKSGPQKESTSMDYLPVPVACWVGLLLVLALIDTEAQQLIRHNPEFSSENWQAAVAMQGNAFVHLCAGILAGLALDRRQLAWASAAALIAICGAVMLLGGAPRYFPTARVFYTAGATIYATAFVYYAARSGRPWLISSLLLGTIAIGVASALGTMNSSEAMPGAALAALAAIAMLAYTLRQLFLKRARTALLELGEAAMPSRRVTEADEKVVQ